MSIVLVICTFILAAATILTSWRILTGPNSLDRVVAIDMLVVIAQCGMALWCLYKNQFLIAPIIACLSLFGFIGSLAVVQFRISDDQKEN